MALEFVFGMFGGMMGIIGVTAALVLGLIFIIIVGFISYKVVRWMKDYPIKATVWTVRANGLYPQEDRIGIFVDRKEGRKYSKLRDLKLELKAVPFEKIESDAKTFGRVALIRKSNEEIIPLNSKELIEMISEGKLAPVVKEEVRYYQAQGVRRDYELLIKGGFLEKYGTLITLVTIALILFITMIVWGTMAEKTLQGMSAYSAGERDNLAAQMYNEKSAEIYLLIYALTNNVSFSDLNQSLIFTQLNLTEIIPNQMVVR